MISITIKDEQVKAMLKGLPKKVVRAAEQSLDKTAKLIKMDVIAEMRKVFDRPAPYTLNSLQVTTTQNHNMVAKVWFKEPERKGRSMSSHYLLPQVEGGSRQLKGFERAFKMQLTPADELGAVKLDSRGNIMPSQIRQILSVTGRSVERSGFDQNQNETSRMRGKERDYVFFRKRLRNGLAPGIYRRVASTRAVRGRYTTLDGKKGRAGGVNAWQTGNHKAAIRARGLMPVFFQNKPQRIKPLLDFHRIARATYNKHFMALFSKHMGLPEWFFR